MTDTGSRRVRSRAGGRVTGTQGLVLGFFAFAWVSLLVILGVAPDVVDQALQISGRSGAAAVFVVLLSAFLGLLSYGVIRRWRWTFWLVLVAFLAGILRVPIAALELADVLPARGPAWYAVFQGLLGVIQCLIGLLMVRAYRRSGIWGNVCLG